MHEYVLFPASLGDVDGRDEAVQYRIVLATLAPGFRGRHPSAPRRPALIGRAGAVLAALLFGQAVAAASEPLRPWTGNAKPAFRLDQLGSAGQRGPADLRGHVVLVHFWATYCEPCRAELPALQRLAARGEAQGLRVLTVSVAEVDPRVERFRDSTGLTLPVLMDRDRRATRAWKVASLPTTFVLDRAGRPRLYTEQDHDWDSVDAAQLAARLAATPDRSTQTRKPGG